MSVLCKALQVGVASAAASTLGYGAWVGYQSKDVPKHLKGSYIQRVLDVWRASKVADSIDDPITAENHTKTVARMNYHGIEGTLRLIEERKSKGDIGYTFDVFEENPNRKQIVFENRDYYGNYLFSGALKSIFVVSAQHDIKAGKYILCKSLIQTRSGTVVDVLITGTRRCDSCQPFKERYERDLHEKLGIKYKK